MERNCPPLLLSIIWESNVLPPRHPREAFWWPGDAREKEGEKERLERSERTHKGSERGDKLTPARENGIPGLNVTGTKAPRHGGRERRLNNAGVK